MSSRKVTKYDLVEAVYQNTKCEKRVVQDVIENLLGQLKDSLKDGNTIELRGFGTFEPRLRRGRAKARNPKTGEQLSVAPAIFSPSEMRTAQAGNRFLFCNGRFFKVRKRQRKSRNLHYSSKSCGRNDYRNYGRTFPDGRAQQLCKAYNW